jgi:hypothetical protein
MKCAVSVVPAGRKAGGVRSGGGGGVGGGSQRDLGESPSRPASMKSLTVPSCLPRAGSLSGQGLLRRNESNVSFHESVQGGATPSLVSSMEFGGRGGGEAGGPGSLPGTPMRHSLTKHLNELDKREDEDLYR